MSYNKLTSLDGLQNCTALKHLNVSFNKLTSLDGLQNCIALQELDVFDNKLTSLDGLQNCIALQELDMPNNKLTSLNGLQNCTALQELDVYYNKLTSLDGLQNCIALQSLDMSNNKLTSLDGLENCTALQSLDMSNNKLTSLNGLQNCTALQELDVYYNKLTSLDGLQNCTALQELDVYYNKLTSLDGLENCTALQSLDMSNNKLTSLDGLQNCIALRKLNIEYNNENITTLPNFLIEFRNLQIVETDGLELELEPRQRRWLNRLQHDAYNSNSVQVYGNTQNVHDSSIQETVRASMCRLLDQPNLPKLSPTYLHTLHNQIVLDSILTPKSKDQLLSYISSDEELLELSLTYSELLWVVWYTIHNTTSAPAIDTDTTIFDEATQCEIKQILNQELADSDCMCFIGRMTRLVNCLNGFSPLVEVKILDGVQIGNVVSIIKKKLEDSEEGYSVEKHKKIFREEMLDRGENISLIEEWLEYIE